MDNREFRTEIDLADAVRILQEKLTNLNTRMGIIEGYAYQLNRPIKRYLEIRNSLIGTNRTGLPKRADFESIIDQILADEKVLDLTVGDPGIKVSTDFTMAHALNSYRSLSVDELQQLAIVQKENNQLRHDIDQASDQLQRSGQIKEEKRNAYALQLFDLGDRSDALASVSAKALAEITIFGSNYVFVDVEAFQAEVKLEESSPHCEQRWTTRPTKMGSNLPVRLPPNCFPSKVSPEERLALKRKLARLILKSVETGILNGAAGH